MSKEYQVIHKKSNVLNNGQPKLPSANTIDYGEIAINYAKGGETMSIKNANNEIVTFSSDAKILGQIPSVADFFDGAVYDTNTKRINFKNGNTVKAYIDASDFIKDGMVDTVTITTPSSGTNSGVTCLVVTFTTDAGKEDIEIPLSNIFNPNNYYTKTESDETFVPLSAYTEDEEVIATALNDLNGRVSTMESNFPQNTSDLYNDSGFVTSAETAHTHTAAEVGAMSSAATLDNVPDGSTRKLANYSLTSHTHSIYSTTAHTHTAADVGAMATSERSNYLTTATTIPEVTVIRYGETIPQSILDELAVDVFGDGDSEEPALLLRLNDGKVATYFGEVYGMGYVFTSVVGTSAETYTYYYAYANGSWTSGNKKLLMSGATLDSIPDGSNRKLSNYSTTAHTHDQYSLTSHTHSIYSTTAHTHTASEVGAMSSAATLDNVADGATRKLSNYSTTAHTHSDYATTAHTHTASEVGAMATSERSNYATTAHTHTAEDVGAMATSERNNYLATGTTLDNVADGSTRKLSNYSTTAHTHTAAQVGAMATSERSNYSTTAHTHSDYATTAHTHTAAEVGAMATSERSNYSTTAHTHTAEQVGAMATSERNNYLATGTTLDNVGDGTTRKLANYATTAHTHTASEVGAMATSERSNYATTAHTHSEYASSAHTHSQYLTGITFNGTAVTVNNGVAVITGNTLPAVTSSDNGKVPMVVEGAWALVTPTTVYTGNSTPQNSMGNDGDIYLQTN